jgi:hypothetical protein
MLMNPFENTQNNAYPNKFNNIDPLKETFVLRHNFTQSHQPIELTIEKEQLILIE